MERIQSRIQGRAGGKVGFPVVFGTGRLDNLEPGCDKVSNAINRLNINIHESVYVEVLEQA